jgi:hypothetical protein
MRLRLSADIPSITDIGRIRKSIVWTLHDIWALSGAEHYITDQRRRDGYRRDNRPTIQSRLRVA